MNLREALLQIRDEHQELTPRIVVDVARDPQHPLHSRFEWDDTVAGEKYREVQARELIRTVKVTYADYPKREVRAFVSVERPEGNEYVPTEVVAVDPFMRQLVLRAAEREWKQMLARYAHLDEFMEIVRRDVAS